MSHPSFSIGLMGGVGPRLGVADYPHLFMLIMFSLMTSHVCP